MKKKDEIKKVVLAYSGGLDTSVIIPWLKENYNNCEVITVTADLGQGDDMSFVHDKALKSGASKAYVLDLRDEFLRDYAWPMVKSGAVYEKKYLLGTSIARPVIAKHLVEVALKENADAICHGATGKGNDQVRFELGIKALAPQLQVIAPWREWNIKSREDAIDFASAHNIPVPVTKKKDYSMDWNLSHEGSDLEDPANEPNPDIYIFSGTPEGAPDKDEYVELEFVEGIPVAVNGKKMEPVELLTTLNEIGKRNGIGIKDRGVYETPGGTIIYYAHNELENICLDRATYNYKEQIGIRYAELVYDGMWFSQLREALQAFVDETQKTVTGTVRLKLYKGNIISAGTTSPYSLYSKEYVTFGEDDVYDQTDAKGFITLFGLPLTVRALMKQGKLK